MRATGPGSGTASGRRCARHPILAPRKGREIAVFGRLFQRREDLLEAGAKARLLHESWLTRALARRQGAIPKIPVRRVSDGGFDGMMRTAEGRAWAAHWWASAWGRLDDDE